jgi:hypothetical protein
MSPAPVSSEPSKAITVPSGEKLGAAGRSVPTSSTRSASPFQACTTSEAVPPWTDVKATDPAAMEKEGAKAFRAARPASA